MSRNSQTVKVLVVGQTPPPFGGQAMMIDKLVRAQLEGVQQIHARMGFSSHMNEVGRVRVGKVLHLFSLIARIIYHRVVDGVRILYYPPAGPDRVPILRDFAVLLCTRWLFDKTVFHFHAGGASELYAAMPAWKKWLFRNAYFRPDAAILLSPLSPPDGRRLEAKRDWVIPNGIEDPCPNPVLTRSTSAATETQPLRILFVGVLRESKGVGVLIEACGQLAARGVPFQLEVMGQWQSDEYKSEIEQRIAELKIGAHVKFLGLLTGDDKLAAFRRAEAFCFPSFFNCEGFPVVLLEALAFSLPVVSTRWRGIPAMIDDGVSGFLVEPHDVKAVAGALETLAYEPELRARMGEAGRERFLEDFTLPAHLERLRQVFLEVAGVSRETQAAPAVGELVAS